MNPVLIIAVPLGFGDPGHDTEQLGPRLQSTRRARLSKDPVKKLTAEKESYRKFF